MEGPLSGPFSDSRKVSRENCGSGDFALRPSRYVFWGTLSKKSTLWRKTFFYTLQFFSNCLNRNKRRLQSIRFSLKITSITSPSLQNVYWFWLRFKTNFRNSLLNLIFPNEIIFEITVKSSHLLHIYHLLIFICGAVKIFKLQIFAEFSVRVPDPDKKNSSITWVFPIQA